LAKSRAVVVVVAVWKFTFAKASLQVIVAAKVAACQRLTFAKSSVWVVQVVAGKPAA